MKIQTNGEIKARKKVKDVKVEMELLKQQG